MKLKIFIISILMLLGSIGYAQTEDIRLPYISVINNETRNVSSSSHILSIAITSHISDISDNPEPYITYMNERIIDHGFDTLVLVAGINSEYLAIDIQENTRVTSRSFTIRGSGGGNVVTINQAGRTPDPDPDPDPSTPGNWILSRTYTASGSTTYYDDITFYDGLGYPSQSINVAASAGTQKNIVTPIVYDYLYRSDSKTYLPYISANNTLLSDPSPLQAQQDYYSTLFNTQEGAYAYAANTYENASGGRLIATTKAGKDYHATQKKISFSYSANGTSDVYQLRLNGTQLSASYYPAGALLSTTTTNEDGGSITIFKDIKGNIILERVENDGNGNRLETYYAYDNNNRINMVLTPQASSGLPTSFQTSDPTIQNLCYLYTYDTYGRLASRKLPGQQPEEFTYSGTSNRIIKKTQGNRVFNYYHDSYGRIVAEKYLKSNGAELLYAEYQYDNISNTTGFQPVSGVVTTADNFPNCKSLKTFERFLILDGSQESNPRYVTRQFFYNYRGELIQTLEQNHLGGSSCISTKYDFNGNVLARHESHQKGYGSTPDIKLTSYAYDQRGRLLSEQTSLNGGTSASVTYEYNPLGQLIKKRFGNNITENIAYNIQGWQTTKTAQLSGVSIYNHQLRYYNPEKGSAPSYAGNISEWSTTPMGNPTSTYGFSYDKPGRLISTNRYEGESVAASQTYTEQGISYDKNGNIVTLQRYTSALADNLAYSYTGNQLTTLSGSINAAYGYDIYGNMTHDGRKNLDITYNFLNLPTVVSQNGTPLANYSYLADGTKLRVKDNSANGFAYTGSLIYTTNASGLTFESTNFSQGRITTNGAPYYYTTDHLGSVRMVTSNIGGPVEINDYYPFGMRTNLGRNYPLLPGNRYQFNGKEEQTTGNLGYLDYGARMYDAQLGRWLVNDPLAEKYYGISTYAYCNNNPALYIDPDGRDWFQSSDGQLMWTRELGSSWVNDIGEIWKNVGENYTFYNKDGSSTFFYQNTNENGEISLASHSFSKNETAGFGLFHSDNAREAAMLDHVKPTMGSYISMVAKELYAQWTDPTTVVSGAMIWTAGVTNKTTNISTNTPKSSVQKISGYTMHGLEQAMMRNEGRGVHPSSILDAVKNPKKVLYQSEGRIKYVGKEATVVLNKDGKIITTYGKPRNYNF